MVKLVKFIGYTLFFMIALMYFTPKVALYYFAESKVQPYGIVVTDENVLDNGLTLSIKDAVVTVKEIPSAEIKNIDIAVFGLYNKVSAEQVTLASSAASFLPTDIKSIDISYSVLDPLNIVASSNGGFGDARAEVNLLDRKLLLKLKPSKLMTTKYRSTLRYLKKSKEGGYEYAKTF